MNTLVYLPRPFNATGLIFIAVFSLLFLIGIQAGILGIALLLILISWFFKYAFVVLDHIAEGQAGTPVLSAEMVNPLSEPRPLWYLVVILIFYTLTGAFGRIIDAQWLSALRLAGLAMLPAVIAVNTVTGTLLPALNPMAFVAIIRRLGLSYLWVVVATGACWHLGESILIDVTNSLLSVVRFALLMLLWLALFSLLGGTIYERREAIGFEPRHSPERSQARAKAEVNRIQDRFIDTLFGEYRSGAYLNAWETVQSRAQRSVSPLDEYRWIYARIAHWPNPRLANRLAQEMLPLLLTAYQFAEAVRILKDRMAVDGDFRPARSDVLLTLAKLARDGGDRRLARGLLKDFERLFPSDPARQVVAQLSVELAR